MTTENICTVILSEGDLKELHEIKNQEEDLSTKQIVTMMKICRSLAQHNPLPVEKFYNRGNEVWLGPDSYLDPGFDGSEPREYIWIGLTSDNLPIVKEAQSGNVFPSWWVPYIRSETGEFVKVDNWGNSDETG